jgi:hypothetical protein
MRSNEETLNSLVKWTGTNELHPHFVTYGFHMLSHKEWEMRGKRKNKLQLHNPVPTPINLIVLPSSKGD